jgi:opacity protein-like surface antigen
MARTWTVLQTGLVATGMLAAPAAAQDVRPAVFGSAAVANIYRAEDRSFGTELNLGGGAGFEWRRLGVDVEFHRTLGLRPEPFPCSVVDRPCTGSAREGVLNATMLTANVSYFFGTRVRPYVTGSVGALWSESVNSLTVVGSTEATLSEFQEDDAGLVLGLGFGVDVPLTHALSLRPEFRTYTADALSRSNLAMHRATVGLRYAW